MSRTLRTPGLPPTHGPVGYRWQNTGSSISLINTRATSCRTETDAPSGLDLTGRRRQKLNSGRLAMRLGELIADYSPLRRLTAFRHAEAETLAVLRDGFRLVTTAEQSG